MIASGLYTNMGGKTKHLYNNEIYFIRHESSSINNLREQKCMMYYHKMDLMSYSERIKKDSRRGRLYNVY